MVNEVGLSPSAGDGGVLGSVLAVPGAVLGGGDVGSSLDSVLDNAGDTLEAAGGIVTSTVSLVGGFVGGSGPASDGLTDTISGLTGGLLGGDGPIDVGGLLGNGGGLLSGLLGGGAGDPAEPLVAADIGGDGLASVVGANLLSSGDSSPSSIEVNAIDTNQPTAVDLSLLTGDQLSFQSLGGAGADSLVGALLDTAPLSLASAEPASLDTGLGLDLGILDLAIVADHDAQAGGQGGSLLSGLGL